MENERPEFLNDPSKRLAREIEMLMTDSEHKDVSEILCSVGVEIPRAINAANEAGVLSDSQREETQRRLNDLREDVSRLPDSDEKKLIMEAFDALKIKLGG